MAAVPMTDTLLSMCRGAPTHTEYQQEPENCIFHCNSTDYYSHFQLPQRSIGYDICMLTSGQAVDKFVSIQIIPEFQL